MAQTVTDSAHPAVFIFYFAFFCLSRDYTYSARYYQPPNLLTRGPLNIISSHACTASEGHRQSVLRSHVRGKRATKPHYFTLHRTSALDPDVVTVCRIDTWQVWSTCSLLSSSKRRANDFLRERERGSSEPWPSFVWNHLTPLLFNIPSFVFLFWFRFRPHFTLHLFGMQWFEIFLGLIRLIIYSSSIWDSSSAAVDNLRKIVGGMEWWNTVTFPVRLVWDGVAIRLGIRKSGK